MSAPEKEIALDVSGERNLDPLLREAKAAGIKTVVSRTGFPASKELDGLSKLEVSDTPKGEHSAAWLQIEGGGDVERAIEASKKGYGVVVVQCNNWKIIPLENLIADFRRRKMRLYAFMMAKGDIEDAFNVLEKGVDGVVIPSGAIAIAKEIAESMRNKRTFPLAPATVTRMVEVGLGERACIDTTSQLSLGEGMLVGSISNFFFLVHSETVPSEYIPTRPFRVNAGAIHSYVLGPDGKTRYLSEIQAADRVQVVSSKGSSRSVSVGRVKIERRPLVMVAAKRDGTEGSVMLQKAETIRLVKTDGSAVAVTDLKEGDQVLVHLGAGTGRHFGGEVDEFVIER